MPIKAHDVKVEEISKELLKAKFGSQPTSQADRDEAERVAREYISWGETP